MWTRAIVILAAWIAGTGALMAETGEVTGSVTYRERIALPPDAVLTVALLDVSKQDVAAEVIAWTEYQMSGVPTVFKLSFEPGQIDERHSYAVRADIRVDGQLMFTNTSAYPVLTRGAGATADIVVERVNVAGQASILGTDWTVVSLGDQPLELDRMPTISFSEDGAVGIFAGCNRYVGTFETDDGSFKLSDNMAGTLMACPPEIDEIERKFLDLMQSVSVVNNNGQVLTLSDADRVLLIRAKAGI
ncbi:MAG: YbaY family lipoprotein [Paracoccaceae bacterium]